MTTDWPFAAEVGLKLVMVGACAITPCIKAVKKKIKKDIFLEIPFKLS